MKEFHIKDIDLNLLLIFYEISQSGSLTLTGEKLGKTQSAISHSLEKLRSIFNDPLFVRSGKGMTPTARAKEIFLPVQDALHSIQLALQPPAGLEIEKLERTFRISMSDYSEMIILPKLMSYLSQHTPSVSLEIIPPSLRKPQEELESGQFELLIGNQDVGGGTYQQSLFEDRFVCLVDRNHPDIQDSLTIEQFLAVPHVLFSPRAREDRLIDKLLKEQRHNRKVALKVPHILVIPEIIKNTQYLVTLPARLAASFDNSHLQVMEPPFELPPLMVMQYWHETWHQDPAHQWLRKTIKALF